MGIKSLVTQIEFRNKQKKLIDKKSNMRNKIEYAYMVEIIQRIKGGIIVKSVILNGSAKDDNILDNVHNVIVDELTRIGSEIKPFILHDMKIAHCLGCSGCWVKTPGICVIKDAGHDVAREFIQSDLVVFLTRVTFGGYSSELKKALDRIISLISPFFVKINGETHHKLRYERYPRLIGIGVLPQADEESEQIFTTLVKRNAINFHPPAHAEKVILSSQGTEEICQEIQTLLHAVEVIQ